VLLLVDAQEGPMPQTRFVLKKSLELGLKPIVVLNKIDKPAANPAQTLDAVLELFLELGANDEQIEFPVVYAIGREGVAIRELGDEKKDLAPLLDVVLENTTNAAVNSDQPFQAQTFSLGYDNFLGRLSIVRVYQGSIKDGSMVTSLLNGGEKKTTFRITKLYSFHGVERQVVDELSAGDIGIIAGNSVAMIGETIVVDTSTPVLPEIAIDPPTISVVIMANDSPFAGKEGKFVTGRQIRERLERELETNVGMRINWWWSRYHGSSQPRC
jgi:GTP-binding protein